MPVMNGLGYGAQTDEKQDHFRKILSLHMDIVQSIRFAKGYTFIDMNAGCGRYNGIEGSPCIFIQERNRLSKPNRGIFIESCGNHASCLKAIVGDEPDVFIHNEDHGDALRRFKNKLPIGFGMIYHDPSGQVPNFELLSEISNYSAFRRVDIMIYLSATNIKRIRTSGRCDGAKCLEDYIPTINKKSWIIREGSGKHQWTFLIGSNWVSFPDWKKLGFYRLEDSRGSSIMNRLNHTSSELSSKSGQLYLF